MAIYVDVLEDDTASITDDSKTFIGKYRVRGARNAYLACIASGTNESGGTTTIPTRGSRLNAFEYEEEDLIVVDISAKRQFAVKKSGSLERTYIVTVTWARYKDRASDPKPGDEKWSWSDRDQNAHVKEAYDQDVYGEKAPANKNLIGVRDDGTIEGVDVLDTNGELTVTKWYLYEEVTTDIVTLWGNMRKTVNDSTYKSLFPAGSLLFLGFSIEPPLSEEFPTQVTFRFAYSANRAGADLPTFQGMGQVGSDGPEEEITVTGGKLGHQYLWTLGGNSSNGTVLERRVKGVYVATLYKTSDFDLLGLNGQLVIDNAGEASS
jgi:hypothetical protein